MSVMDKLKKNSKVKFTSVLDKSEFFTEKEMVTTPVPMINAALSGDLDGGLTSGLTVLAGPSKHFKTSFALLMASAYLKEHEDAVLLFYDSEFGSPQSYFEAVDIEGSLKKPKGQLISENARAIFNPLIKVRVSWSKYSGYVWTAGKRF